MPKARTMRSPIETLFERAILIKNLFIVCCMPWCPLYPGYWDISFIYICSLDTETFHSFIHVLWILRHFIHSCMFFLSWILRHFIHTSICSLSKLVIAIYFCFLSKIINSQTSRRYWSMDWYFLSTSLCKSQNYESFMILTSFVNLTAMKALWYW